MAIISPNNPAMTAMAQNTPPMVSLEKAQTSAQSGEMMAVVSDNRESNSASAAAARVKAALPLVGRQIARMIIEDVHKFAGLPQIQAINPNKPKPENVRNPTETPPWGGDSIGNYMVNGNRFLIRELSAVQYHYAFHSIDIWAAQAANPATHDYGIGNLKRLTNRVKNHAGASKALADVLEMKMHTFSSKFKQAAQQALNILKN